jgi:tetratricopeptide (TPR) repeat protein
MQFEMTRAEPVPDATLLADAMRHAREACRIDPAYGEGWATLGLVLERTGRHTDAIAAARRSVSLEPDNWRHHVRLAYTSWGEERLRGARRTLTLFPGFAIGHWLAATVLVARQALDEAARELDLGLAAPGAPARRFSAVALHWLRGLIALAGDRRDDARAHFAEELRHEHSGQLYARECCANTWYAIGALEAREGRIAAADAAFGEVLSRLGGHPLAAAARQAVRGAPLSLASSPPGGSAPSAVVDRALAVAVYRALTGDADDAAAADVNHALNTATAGSAGWLLPVEPVLHVSARPGLWAAALATLRHRAA